MQSRANRRPVLPNYSTLGSWHYWQVNQYASSPLFRKLLATFPLESAEGDKWPSEKFVGQISRKASRPGWGLNPRPLASQPLGHRGRLTGRRLRTRTPYVDFWPFWVFGTVGKSARSSFRWCHLHVCGIDKTCIIVSSISPYVRIFSIFHF